MPDAMKIYEDALIETRLKAFVEESNRIESIDGFTPEHIKAHKHFIKLKRPTVEHLVRFVRIMQPDARLRILASIPDVRVGRHIPPPSGGHIFDELHRLLKRMRNAHITPWEAHCEYLTLHPFTDGNGRSARALWLWHMTYLGQQPRALGRPFLQSFYYQTLDSHDTRKAT